VQIIVVIFAIIGFLWVLGRLFGQAGSRQRQTSAIVPAGSAMPDQLQSQIAQIDHQMEQIEKEVGFDDSAGIKPSLLEGLIEWEDCVEKKSSRLKKQWFTLAADQERLETQVSKLEQQAFLQRALQHDPDALRSVAWSIANDLRFKNVKRPHVLAFQALRDNRPSYLENAILATEMSEAKWSLAHAFRASATGTWQISHVYDVPHTGLAVFDHMPTEKEVDTFLKDTWWEFNLKPTRRFMGYLLLRGEVFAEEWQSALGYQPQHSYS
jgi:hypothetical protein